jgi:hypothetical protein
LSDVAQVGTALGLAVLIPLSAARTDAGVPPETALVEGFRWGFLLCSWSASRGTKSGTARSRPPLSCRQVERCLRRGGGEGTEGE